MIFSHPPLISSSSFLPYEPSLKEEETPHNPILILFSHRDLGDNLISNVQPDAFSRLQSLIAL